MAENNKRLVLVVDDESHILHVVSLKLRNAGYEVITADNGEEGFRAASEHRPDLIITDFQMPVLSGVDMCRRMKQDETLRSTPALLLTGRGFSLSPEALETTNIIAVLSKPFSPREILGRVQDVLGTKAMKGSPVL